MLNNLLLHVKALAAPDIVHVLSGNVDLVALGVAIGWCGMQEAK